MLASNQPRNMPSYEKLGHQYLATSNTKQMKFTTRSRVPSYDVPMFPCTRSLWYYFQPPFMNKLDTSRQPLSSQFEISRLGRGHNVRISWYKMVKNMQKMVFILLTTKCKKEGPYHCQPVTL